MKTECSEPSEAQNDQEFREYMEGFNPVLEISRLIPLSVALEAIYRATERRPTDD